MRTSSNCPVRGLTRRTIEPKGRLGWAAVRVSQSNRLALDVLRPVNSVPYQLALPTQVLIGLAGSVLEATRGASITGAMRNISGTHRTAAQIMKSGFFISVVFILQLPEKCSRKTSLCQPISEKNLPPNSFMVNKLISHM